MITHDYYTIRIPGDIADDLSTLADTAIEEAASRTKLRVIPADWTVKHVSGQPGDLEVVFRVRRTRIRLPKRISDTAVPGIPTVPRS